MDVPKVSYEPLLMLLISLNLSVSSSQTNRACSPSSQDESAIYSRDKMNHHDAKHWIKGQCESGRLHACRSQDNSTQDEQLHGNMVWLDVTREMIPWQWVDGAPAGSNPFHKKRKHRKRNKRNERCALLHAGEGHIVPYHCLTKEPSALCQLHANKTCQVGAHWCEEISGSCFCVIDPHHWYHARDACEDIGGRLSILPDESLRKDIAQVMKKRPPKLTNNWLWIGLHGENWFENSGHRKGQPAETVLFVPEKESDGRKNCAVTSTAGNDEVWYAVNCQEKHIVLGICPRDQEQMRADPTSHTSTAEGPKDHTQENRELSRSTFLAVGSAVVSSPTLCIIFIGMCLGIQNQPP